MAYGSLFAASRLYNVKQVVLAAALSLTLIAGVAAPAVAQVATTDSNSREAQEWEFLKKINEERAAHGVQALRMQVETRNYARFHADRMRDAGTIWHDMESFKQHVPSGWQGIAENVGYNGTIEWLHTSLMNSAGHRANILNPDFNYIGIGIAQHANGALYASQNFVKHPSPLSLVEESAEKVAETPMHPAPAPTVSLSATATTISVGSRTTFKAEIFNMENVAKVSFYIDNVLKRSDWYGPYAYSWASYGVPVGTHSVTAKAYDTAGNVISSNEIIVTVTPSTVVGDTNGDGRLSYSEWRALWR